jgi:hypothetical protein
VAPGYWSPQTSAGRELIGHEVAHVLQQRAGRVAPTGRIGGVPLNDSPSLEREAHAQGTRAATAAAPRHRAAATHPGSASARPVVQRWPPGGAGDDIHDPLLDQFSAETGTPRDQASQHSLAYEEWLLMRRFAPLSTERLLDTLATEAAAPGGLAGLVGNARRFSRARYGREITAIEVVHAMRSGAPDPAAANAAITAGSLSAADQLAMQHFVRVPFSHGADQRVPATAGAPAATGVPDTDLAREVGYELDPSSRPGPAPVGGPPPARIPWDGSTGAAGAAAARATMKAELFAAFDAYLAFFAARVATILAPGASRVPFTAPAPAAGAGAGANPPTGAVDIANQARGVLEARYGVAMDAAAATPAQAFSRDPRVASPAATQNIFDPYDAAQRATLRGVAVADLAQGVAWWMFQNDVPGAAGTAGSRQFASEVLAAHHWSSQDPGANAFRNDVARDYVAAAPGNRQALLDYRLAQWSERGPRGITLLSSFTPGANAGLAERQARWSIFKTAVHESLHLRTHPAFSTAAQGRGTMVEGFTEMFAVDTLNAPGTGVLPRVRAGSLEALRRTVEGTLATATPDTAVITNRTTPTQYVAHREAAERIRDGGTPVAGGPSHAGVGETGVRAAYFQGHVEYLGLTPAGAALGGLPAPGAPRRLRVPTGIATVDDLAWRSGVPRASIDAENPGIAPPLPPDAVLPGAREHVVVVADATHPTTGVRTTQPETRANIAAQHGVSEADLVRANPDIPRDPATSAWPALTVGQKILIPRH